MNKWKIYVKLQPDYKLSDYMKILKEDDVNVYGRKIDDMNVYGRKIDDVNIIIIEWELYRDIKYLTEKYSWISFAMPISDPITIEYPSNYKPRQTKRRRYINYSSNPYSHGSNPYYYGSSIHDNHINNHINNNINQKC